MWNFTGIFRIDFTAYTGDSTFDIKETLNPIGKHLSHLNAETTSSKQYSTDISEKDPNNDVNIATGKNENPSASRVEPSEPSEPSEP